MMAAKMGSGGVESAKSHIICEDIAFFKLTYVSRVNCF